MVWLLKPVHAQAPVKHGGVIESKYDGLTYETVLRLRKMKVSCDGVRDRFNKDGCVSIDVKLHLPGVQLNHVRNVTLQVIFEHKDWVHIHPLHLRDLTITTNLETLRFGRMELVTNQKTGTWDTKIETLEAKIPYEVFKRVIRGGDNRNSGGRGRRAAARQEHRRTARPQQPRSRRSGNDERYAHICKAFIQFTG